MIDEMLQTETPRLIDIGAKRFMQTALESCHGTRIQTYTYILNVGILIAFVVIVGLALYFSYKNRPSPEEAAQKLVRDEAMVLSKIRFYQAEQKNQMSSPIGLAHRNLRDYIQ